MVHMRQLRRRSSGVVGMQITNDCIKNMPLFTGCDKAFIDRVAMDASIHMYCAGETIVKEGDIGETMYIINRGDVEVLVNNGDGEPQRVATLGDGDFFGEIALLGLQTRRAATIKAISFVDTRSLERPLFLRSLKMFPYEKAVFEAEASRRFLESRSAVGNTQRGSVELKKKSCLLRKLLQFGKGNTDVETAKKKAKDRRCLSSMTDRRLLSPNSPEGEGIVDIPPANASGAKRKTLNNTRASLMLQRASLTKLPSVIADEDNRRLSNVGRMKMFGSKRMSISQGMGRTRRWSVCGSGGLAKTDNTLHILPTISAEETSAHDDFDTYSTTSFADDRIDVADLRRNTLFSYSSQSVAPSLPTNFLRPPPYKVPNIESQMRSRISTIRKFPVVPAAIELPSSAVPVPQVLSFSVRWKHKSAAGHAKPHGATYTQPLDMRQCGSHRESVPASQFVNAFAVLFENTARVYRWPEKALSNEPCTSSSVSESSSA